jgi:hypothetical protein
MGWDGTSLRGTTVDTPTFSFENVCDVLGVDAAYLRGGLRRWRAAQLAAADDGTVDA